jgi:hypothetical protein
VEVLTVAEGDGGHPLIHRVHFHDQLKQQS